MSEPGQPGDPDGQEEQPEVVVHAQPARASGGTAPGDED